MRKFIASLVVFSVLTPAFVTFMPAFAMADATVPFQSPLQPTAQQLMTRVAALQALVAAASSSSPVSCAALFSAPQVKVGDTVIVAWGSVGALPPGSNPNVSMWPQEGASTLSFTKAGYWKYSFTFYAANNATTTCTATVHVLPT